MAPGAAIAVYFAPNTDQGFMDAVSTAIHDTTNKPSVLSISWGGPEDTWTAQACARWRRSSPSAGGLGVTVTVAAGDNGSTDGVSDGSRARGLPGLGPARARLWRHDAAGRRRGRSRARRSGTTARAAVRPAAASRPSSRCPATSRRPVCPATPTAARRAGGCRTSAATPIRTPATRYTSTVRARSSAARAPSRRCGRG